MGCACGWEEAVEGAGVREGGSDGAREAAFESRVRLGGCRCSSAAAPGAPCAAVQVKKGFFVRVYGVRVCLLPGAFLIRFRS